MFEAILIKRLRSTFAQALWLVASVMPLLTSCKKVHREEIFPASLTIVNAVNNNSSFLSVYFGESSPKFHSLLAYIHNGDALHYTSNKMNQLVTLFIDNDTLHTTKPLLKSNIPLEPAGIYTHFIYGSPSQIKEITIKENIPLRNPQDSIANLCIMNLFENRSIDVVQLEPAAGVIVSNLPYEQRSSYFKIPVNHQVATFRFEVIDHATGITLTTLSTPNIYPGSSLINNQWLFKTRTLLVHGSWRDASDFSAQSHTIGHF